MHTGGEGEGVAEVVGTRVEVSRVVVGSMEVIVVVVGGAEKEEEIISVEVGSAEDVEIEISLLEVSVDEGATELLDGVEDDVSDEKEVEAAELEDETLTGLHFPAPA